MQHCDLNSTLFPSSSSSSLDNCLPTLVSHPSTPTTSTTKQYAPSFLNNYLSHEFSHDLCTDGCSSQTIGHITIMENIESYPTPDFELNPLRLESDFMIQECLWDTSCFETIGPPCSAPISKDNAYLATTHILWDDHVASNNHYSSGSPFCTSCVSNNLNDSIHTYVSDSDVSFHNYDSDNGCSLPTCVSHIVDDSSCTNISKVIALSSCEQEDSIGIIIDSNQVMDSQVFRNVDPSKSEEYPNALIETTNGCVDCHIVDKEEDARKVVRFCVKSDNPTLFDGYIWRKYGQKGIKGRKFPRSYFRCSQLGCPIKKHAESSSDMEGYILITYIGRHNHIP